MELGILKQVQLRTLDRAVICGGVDLRFTYPAGKDIKAFGPWDPSCKVSVILIIKMFAKAELS
jgi:hypothetical protein